MTDSVDEALDLQAKLLHAATFGMQQVLKAILRRHLRHAFSVIFHFQGSAGLAVLAAPNDEYVDPLSKLAPSNVQGPCSCTSPNDDAPNSSALKSFESRSVGVQAGHLVLKSSAKLWAVSSTEGALLQRVVEPWEQVLLVRDGIFVMVDGARQRLPCVKCLRDGMEGYLQVSEAAQLISPCLLEIPNRRCIVNTSCMLKVLSWNIYKLKRSMHQLGVLGEILRDGFHEVLALQEVSTVTGK